MRFKIQYFFLLATTFLFLLCSGCATRRYIMSSVDIVPPPETNAPLADVPDKVEHAGILTETMPFRESITVDQLAGFNPHAGSLWPGALIQGESLQDGVFASIVTARRPLTVTISGVYGTNVTGSVTVPKPTFASVEDARLKLLSQHLVSPAKFSYVQKQFFSLDQAMLEIGASVDYLGSSLKASLRSEQYSENNNLIVQFTQEHYTYSAEPPSSPTSYFGRNVTVDDLTPYSNPTNNPITYVQSVTYGRMAILIVSSTTNIEELKEAVEATYDWATGNAGMTLNSQTISVMKNSELKLLVIGGNAQLALKAVGSADVVLPALRDFIQNGGDVPNALPISYRINYLKDNRPALVSFATNYKRVNKSEIPQIKKLSVHFHTNGENKDGDTGVSIEINNTDGRKYARWQQSSDEDYGPGSDKDKELSTAEPLLIRDLPNVRVTIHIEPQGSDTWTFNYSITGTTTDGRVYRTGSDGCELSDGHQDRTDRVSVIQP